jgi:Xaa-Pro aminopeptidase
MEVALIEEAADVATHALEHVLQTVVVGMTEFEVAGRLEKALRDTGPTPPTLVRRGEVVVVESARITRGDHGETVLGRAEISLDPTGAVRITRTDTGTAPGRMRRESTQKRPALPR